LTRCRDFYERWSRDPNWCEHSPSTVSQINAYITLVSELEQMGCDREFAIAKMSEGAAPRERPRTIRNALTVDLKPDGKGRFVPKEAGD